MAGPAPSTHPDRGSVTVAAPSLRVFDTAALRRCVRRRLAARSALRRHPHRPFQRGRRGTSPLTMRLDAAGRMSQRSVLRRHLVGRRRDVPDRRRLARCDVPTAGLPGSTLRSPWTIHVTCPPFPGPAAWPFASRSCSRARRRSTTSPSTLAVSARRNNGAQRRDRHGTFRRQAGRGRTDGIHYRACRIRAGCERARAASSSKPARPRNSTTPSRAQISTVSTRLPALRCPGHHDQRTDDRAAWGRSVSLERRRSIGSRPATVTADSATASYDFTPDVDAILSSTARIDGRARFDRGVPARRSRT